MANNEERLHLRMPHGTERWIWSWALDAALHFASMDAPTKRHQGQHKAWCLARSSSVGASYQLLAWWTATGAISVHVYEV